MRSEAEIRALRNEGQQYVAAGMLDRAKLVNADLVRAGADPIALPKQTEPSTTAAPRQKRTSTQAATRQKRGA